jgi:retron-type reverse transcriptase
MYWKSRVIDLRHNYQLINMVQRPKCGPSESLGTTGNPKGRKTYGIGGLVRSLGTKRSYSASTFSALACGSLEELVNLNKINKQLVNDKLIHIIANPEVLSLAYETIKSKPGNETPGVDPQALAGIDLNWVQSTCKLLLAGKYKFKAARRVYIPKKDKNKKRPLTISSPRDKAVQQAMYLVLNAIYEPSFLESSHGSRPGKSNHTALKSRKLKFQGVKWCIEADMESNFSSISHKILLSLLRKRISCEKFLTLVKRSIKAGFVEDGVFKESNKGLFQGNVISPILNNVYLHELDLSVYGLRENFVSGKYRRITGRPILKAPIIDLFLKSTVNRFFKKKAGKFVPTKVGWLINLDHVDILRHYNSVIREILNSYSFSNNRKSLGGLVHGLKFSCARTLALKYKLRFASKTFSRFGGKLKCPDTGLELFIPRTFRATKEFAIKNESLFM